MKSETTEPVRSTAGRVDARRLALILAALSSFAPFATDMYLASFRRLSEVFATDLGSVQLGLSVFFLGLAVGQLFYGPLIDRFGRKKPMMAGIALFTVTSLLIVVAPNIGSFILLRFVEAVGGCAGMIISRAIIADLYTARDSAQVLSLMMLVQGVAPILAPIVGGYILVLAGWQAIFLFLTAFGLACLLAVHWCVPETLAVEQRRRESPLVMLRAWGALLVSRRYLVPTLTGALGFASTFAFITGSPFVYMQLYGVSESHYGWLFGLNAFGMIVAIQINRILLKRFSATAILDGAFVVFAVAAGVLMVFGEVASLPVLVALLFVCLANGPLIGANTVAIAMESSGAYRGGGSAILGVLQFALASLTSAGVGLLHDGSVLPMTGIIFVCALLAALLWFFGGTRRSAR